MYTEFSEGALGELLRQSASVREICLRCGEGYRVIQRGRYRIMYCRCDLATPVARKSLFAILANPAGSRSS